MCHFKLNNFRRKTDHKTECPNQAQNHSSNKLSSYHANMSSCPTGHRRQQCYMMKIMFVNVSILVALCELQNNTQCLSRTITKKFENEPQWQNKCI